MDLKVHSALEVLGNLHPLFSHISLCHHAEKAHTNCQACWRACLLGTLSSWNGSVIRELGVKSLFPDKAEDVTSPGLHNHMPKWELDCSTVCIPSGEERRLSLHATSSPSLMGLSFPKSIKSICLIKRVCPESPAKQVVHVAPSAPIRWQCLRSDSLSTCALGRRDTKQKYVYLCGVLTPLTKNKYTCGFCWLWCVL